MNAIVPSGKPINFEYSSFDGLSSLFPAMKVYDLSSGTAVLVATVGMTHVFNGTYWGTYTFPVSSSGKNFLIQKSVYTDNTYTVLNSLGYSPGSEIVEVDGFDNNNGRAS